LYNPTRQTVDKIDCYHKSFVPIFERHGCMSKKTETNFNYMAMLTFSRAVLLMSMETGDMVGNTNTREK
jgi:hypothetical protein